MSTVKNDFYNNKFYALLLTKDKLTKRLKKIKLIATDVDGTITNKNNEIGEITKDIIKKLKRKNILFTFATQRIHSSVTKFVDELEIKIPVISANGALLKDYKGFTLYKSTINPKSVKRALDFAEKYFVRVALCYNDEIVYTESNSVLRDYLYRLGTDYKLVDSYDNYMDDVIEIIMMGNEKNVIKHIQRKMNFPYKLYLKSKYFRSSTRLGIYNLEIKRSRTNKRTGLKRLVNYLNLRRNQVAVIGDWYNDRELFEFGGLNIALENAVAELKNKAHYITDRSNEEDGVADFLQLLYDCI